MNMSEIDRLIAERKGRLEDKKARGILPFEKEKIDPEVALTREVQQLQSRLRELDILAYDGVTPAMETEAHNIQLRMQSINNEIMLIRETKV